MQTRLGHALKFAAKLTRQRPNRPGFIYLIECHEFVKVGIADDANSRLVQLQVGCPYELRLLASFPTQHAARDEARLHGLWKRYEVRGEWFIVPAGELAWAMNASTFDDIFSK